MQPSFLFKSIISGTLFQGWWCDHNLIIIWINECICKNVKLCRKIKCIVTCSSRLRWDSAVWWDQRLQDLCLVNLSCPFPGFLRENERNIWFLQTSHFSSYHEKRGVLIYFFLYISYIFVLSDASGDNGHPTSSWSRKMFSGKMYNLPTALCSASISLTQKM